MTSVPMQAIPRPPPDDNSDKRVTEPLVAEFQCVDKRVGPWLVGLLRGLPGAGALLPKRAGERGSAHLHCIPRVRAPD
jgi:hypothetical protein